MPNFRLTYTYEIEANDASEAMTCAQEGAAQSAEMDWTVEDGDDPSTSEVYTALEEAIDAACDVDTRNDISREYRRIMRERGFMKDNEESGDEESED